MIDRPHGVFASMLWAATTILLVTDG